MKPKIYLASQKRTDENFPVFARLIQWWDKSEFFHSAIYIEHTSNAKGRYYSSYVRRGVHFQYDYKDVRRFKYQDVTYLVDEQTIADFYAKTKGYRYDFLSILGFLFRFLNHDKRAYICSEWCAEALKVFKGHEHKVSPGTLDDLIREKTDSYNRGKASAKKYRDS